MTKKLQGNSTRQYRANIPEGGNGKRTQLSIPNKETEVPQHQTVIQQRYPTVEYPVESTHWKERDFCVLLF